MKYMQFNLENFGGYDVEFPLNFVEHNCRIREARTLRSTNPEKFETELKKSAEKVQKNITYFSSEELCEGPDWDEFREAFVDMICKYRSICFVDEAIA